MSVNGLTLDKLSDTQRGTMIALRSMGGTGMRRDIANAAGITNMRLVTLALGRLETFGFVDQRNDRLWKCTSEGLGLFSEAPVSEPQSLETSENAEPETLSEPSESVKTVFTNNKLLIHISRNRHRTRLVCSDQARNRHN